jgi:four helix bundle protein
MGTINSFKDLIVWQKAMELAREVYSITELLPPKENYGLSSQMRRSAVSIPSNIAEGNKRGTRKDFSHFLKTAHGSSAELETQLLLVESIYKNISVIKAMALITEVQKILTVMIKKLDSE